MSNLAYVCKTLGSRKFIHPDLSNVGDKRINPITIIKVWKLDKYLTELSDVVFGFAVEHYAENYLGQRFSDEKTVIRTCNIYNALGYSVNVNPYSVEDPKQHIVDTEFRSISIEMIADYIRVNGLSVVDPTVLIDVINLEINN
jgi:hypothetical protein